MEDNKTANQTEENQSENAEASLDNGEDNTTSGADATAQAEPTLEQQLQEALSKYMYAMAELDNTRKRHAKERSELLKYAGENMARDLLEVLDDLERAASQSIDTESATILEGINLISNRMRTLFERYGVKAEDSIGSLFDPKKHEALTMIPSAPEESGKVLQQVSRCYFYKDKLLRPAQVIVGSGEPAKTENT